ncbi:TPA: hypothetical protein ACX6RV_001404 [Photobacterium damselae]
MKFCKNILLFIILFILPSTLSYAFTLTGKITGSRIQWENSIPYDGDATLSTWAPQAGLPTTKLWRPGFLAAQPPSNINLSGPGGFVETQLEITGIEYNLGGVLPKKTNVSTGSVCDSTSKSGNIVKIKSNNKICLSSVELENSNSIMPFYFLRPIFSIDEDALLKSFEGKAEGNYVGSVPVTIRYYFKEDSGVFTYRNITTKFDIRIYFVPSFITNVLVNGNGILEPKYDTISHTVSSNTSFDIVSIGYFNNGLKVSFPNRDYLLKKGEYSIPYSISCTGSCSNQFIVSEGRVKYNSTIISPDNANKIAKFKLNISYDDIQASSVTSGKYSDSFTLLFEADF